LFRADGNDILKALHQALFVQLIRPLHKLVLWGHHGGREHALAILCLGNLLFDLRNHILVEVVFDEQLFQRLLAGALVDTDWNCANLNARLHSFLVSQKRFESLLRE
jgi:hypothetical protein